jgi:hypothetical protein
VRRAFANRVKGHKYGATATTVDGIQFASKAEARRYSELRLLEKAGAIRGLTLQPRYDIYALAFQAAPVKVAFYKADFRYMVPLMGDKWKTVVEDVKGVRTEVYRLKKKLVEAQYGIQITEVS